MRVSHTYKSLGVNPLLLVLLANLELGAIAMVTIFARDGERESVLRDRPVTGVVEHLIAKRLCPDWQA